MKKISAFFLLIFLLSCAKISDMNFSEISINNGEKIIKIKVEIADDNEERQHGLMFRETLDEYSGMFFIFENENYQTFWMKKTLIPLDIVFIDKNFEIVEIKYAVPCRQNPCPLYKSSKPAKYVLEVNSNFTTRNNIDVGDRIVLNQN